MSVILLVTLLLQSNGTDGSLPCTCTSSVPSPGPFVKGLCSAGTWSRDGTRGGPLGYTCSPCAAGHWCGAGSISPTEHACGDPSFYCPPGSSAPTPARVGCYTTSAPGDGYVHRRIGLSRLLPGQPPPLPESNAPKVAEGPPAQLVAAVEATALAGLAAALAPPLNSLSEPWVDAARAGGTTAVSSTCCPPGTFCAGGVARPCPSGRYGSKWGEASPGCEGPCAAGFWCPEGSVRATQRRCGNESVYCVAGSGAPTAVPVGFYSLGGLGAGDGGSPPNCAWALGEEGLAPPEIGRAHV